MSKIWVVYRAYDDCWPLYIPGVETEEQLDALFGQWPREALDFAEWLVEAHGASEPPETAVEIYWLGR